MSIGKIAELCLKAFDCIIVMKLPPTQAPIADIKGAAYYNLYPVMKSSVNPAEQEVSFVLHVVGGSP